MINIKKLRRKILDPDSIYFYTKRALKKNGIAEIKRQIRLAKSEGRLSQKEVEIIGRNINILKQILKTARFQFIHWENSQPQYPPIMVKTKTLIYDIEGYFTNRGYLTRKDNNDLLCAEYTWILGYKTKWHTVWFGQPGIQVK